MTKYGKDELMPAVAARIRHVNIAADIGCGIRPFALVKANEHLCIDPWPEYILHIQERLVENKTKLILNDWAGFLNSGREFNSAFLIDVIEHLDKYAGQTQLKRTQDRISDQCVIFTPYGYLPQMSKTELDEWGYHGAHLQMHRSGWYPEDFGNEWEILLCENFHTDYMQKRFGFFDGLQYGAMFAILDKNK